MALLLDASTPNAVTATSSVNNVANTVTTTASFTPPVGAVLVVIFVAQTAGTGTTLSNIGVTDSLGTHLTYTQSQQVGVFSNDTLITTWYSSPVLSSTAMTVSTTVKGNTSGESEPLLVRVLVLTGADTSDPIGATGGARDSTTNINVSYVSTRSGSWGWLVTADWAQKGIPTVPPTETVDSSYDVAGNDTYAVIKQNSLTTSLGTTVAMSTLTPNSAAQITYAYFEIIPALVGPTIGSVPAGTALSTPALSAKFLFFDTGDYGIGV